MTFSRLTSRTMLLLVVVAGAAFITYAPSLGNDFVVWDDDSLVYENPLTQKLSAKTVASAFTSYDPELYVPLTILSFQIEHELFGFRPFFYHLDNLLLHVLVSILIFLLLQRLGLRAFTAFLAVLVFAVHPINTEAVAWVSARKDLLCAVFSLGAVFFYLEKRRWMTVTLTILALLSKPLAIMLPFIFLLLDWKEHGRLRKPDITGKIPLFALSIIFLIIGLYGKQRNIEALSILQTLLLACKSTVFGLQKFFWPSALSPIYLQTDPIALTSLHFLVPILILAALAVLTAWSLRQTLVIAFGFLWFLLWLLPSFSNFAKDHSIYFFSDRYVYLGQIGLLFILGTAIDRVVRAQHAAPLLLLPVAGFFAWAAHAQSMLWKDSETLYRDALTKNDRSIIMHYNLAVLEHARGNRSEAMKHYERTLQLDSSYAKARANIGLFWMEEGEDDKAIEELRLAIESDPALPEPYNTMGLILTGRGELDAAVTEFQKAIALNDRYAQAFVNLAIALGKQEKFEEGLEAYRKAFMIDPRLQQELPEIWDALNSAQ